MKPDNYVLGLCVRCQFRDLKSDFPNLWCNKLMEMINGRTVSNMAKLGCNQAKEELKKDKEAR